MREAFLEAARIGELSWEALSRLSNPPPLKDLQQLLELFAGKSWETELPNQFVFSACLY